MGADGLHSTTRRLAFGPESDYVRHLSWYYALADVDVAGGSEPWGEPGRLVTTGGPRTPASYVFASEPLANDREDVERQKQLLAKASRGAAGGRQSSSPGPRARRSPTSTR